MSGRCPGGWRRESEDPRSHTSEEEEPPDEWCRNCNGIHPGTCPCGWCNQLGHIAAQCTAKYDSEEMNQRFPKRQKKKKPAVAKYQCWKCSQYHSFKEYCPNVSYPPPRLGECKACGRINGRHAPGCDYDAIRRRLLLCNFCGKAGHLHQDCREKRRLRNREQGESEPTGQPGRDREDTEETTRDWEHPGVYPKWELHPDGFEVLNRGRPPTQVTTPNAGKDTSPKQVRIKDTVPKEPVADCSFCGGTGHTYAVCMVLKQMVQEQVELLQWQRTEEYREAQSRSVRQTIVEEYGAEEDPSRRGNVHPGGVLQPSRMGTGTLPSDRGESRGRRPYPTTSSLARRVQEWEDDMPRDATRETGQWHSTAHGMGTRGVYFPRYQRPTSTSTPYEAHGGGYHGGEWHPLEDHREVEDDHPGVGQEEGEAIMTPMMVEMMKKKTTNQSHPLKSGGEG